MVDLKGQAINIDWVTGLSLFMIAVVSSTLIMVNDRPRDDKGLEKKAEDLSGQLKDHTMLKARQNTLYVRGPHDIGKVPVDRKYDFPSDAASGVMDAPADIDESADSVVTVVDTGNHSYNMTYFFEGLDAISYSNDIDTGSWMNNTYLSVLPSATGLDSLRINDKEMLNTTADFKTADTSIDEKTLHAEAGRLKIYNGSKELILEKPEATFYLKNFTTLYWGEDDSTYGLTGTGTIKQGSTPGFTLATYKSSSYGLTFTGDLEAKVSKPDPLTVKAEVNGSRARIMLHETGYTKGEKRINFSEKGHITFGAEKEVSGVYPSNTNSLKNMARVAFENKFDLGSYGYNISFIDVERGSLLPFKDVVAYNRQIAVIDRYGNFTNDTIKVRLWR